MAKQDGRNLRSINSKKLIVDACIKLFKAGNLEPTAQQVANESGVGIRTVFRQFDEMENLFKSVDAVLSKEYDFEVRYDPSSSFETRLQSTINHMNAGYEKHKLIMFMTVSKMWKYRFLKENYRGAISDLHIEHQEKYLKQLENETNKLRMLKRNG